VLISIYLFVTNIMALALLTHELEVSTPSWGVIMSRYQRYVS